MANLPFSLFKQNNNTYEVVDKSARNDISKLMQQTIDQTAGSHLYIESEHSGFFVEANKWETTVVFPFITKNRNYDITISDISALYIGNIGGNAVVIQKHNNGFVLSGTKDGIPANTHCIGTVIYTITFNED